MMIIDYDSKRGASNWDVALDIYCVCFSLKSYDGGLLL